MATKERIKPPTRKELTDAGKQTRKRHPSGARVLAEQSVAVHEGVRPKKRIVKRGIGRRVAIGPYLGVRTGTRKSTKRREYKRSIGKRS